MSSKHGDEVDGYLQDFAEWAVKEDFSQDVEDWMEKHCDIFEHAELDGEQNLQFTKLHTKYVAWLESYITKFCDLNDVDEDNGDGDVDNADADEDWVVEEDDDESEYEP